MPSFDNAEFDLGGAFKPPTLTDDSPFPFGTHKGTPMSDVPAEYLTWCSQQDWIESRYKSVADYIRVSWKAISMEMNARHTRVKYYDEREECHPGSNEGDYVFNTIDPNHVPF